MEERCLTNNCSFAGLKPIMVDLPYPEIKVQRRNRDYADLLSVDYCGFVSELSAITQYINNENRICAERCSMARTLLGIAMAEMMHLQKLGELIVLLGGIIDFSAKTSNGCSKLWTPEYLSIPERVDKMLAADIEAEKEAIRQYEMHINMINDDCVNAVLRRIILDEEYHIFLLKALKNDR
ncbi:ferritin-like domain-containing protein [Parablautia muri]|uniref:Rubrerythrin family protein n=1 Tax=Parablautia muri TaxID=2320879 RepID=A0A9X5GRI7_9FIRM|nr:ferritin family protein [Parablautia muri]NBJ93263.1 rubrerythrin family protein [Parablautia muri]